MSARSATTSEGFEPKAAWTSRMRGLSGREGSRRPRDRVDGVAVMEVVNQKICHSLVTRRG